MANAKEPAAPKSYSYAIAKEVLSENDKNRLVCLYLNCDPKAVSHTLSLPSLDL